MSRVIKFRAWNKIREEMVPVAQVQFGDDGSALTLLVETAPLQHGTWPLVDGESCYLMQFTGLKDKNGKEVWEGDCMLTDDVHHDYEGGVAINALPNGKIHPVVFRDGAFFAGDEPLFEYASAWDVAGNIYENPELLKV